MMDDQQLDRRGTQKLGVGLRGEKHSFRARFTCRVLAKIRGGAGDRKAENAEKKNRTIENSFCATWYLVPNIREAAPNRNREQ